MKKISLILSLICMYFSTLAYAAETTSAAQIFSVDSISEIFTLLEENAIELNDKTLVVLDFDETIAHNILSIDDTRFLLAGNIERQRIYNDATIRVCEKLGIPTWQNYISANKLHFQESIEPLETCTATTISRLQKNGAHVVVCSGRPNKEEKTTFLQTISSDKKIPYYYVQGTKMNVLNEIVNDRIKSFKLHEIETIILIDNNKRMGPSSLESTLSDSENLRNQHKIIGIHLKYFDNIHTEEALEEEYRKIMMLLG